MDGVQAQSPPRHARCISLHCLSTSISRLQVIQHGACLGLGIAALGTEDEEAFEDVKNVLYMDNAGGLAAFGVCILCTGAATKNRVGWQGAQVLLLAKCGRLAVGCGWCCMDAASSRASMLAPMPWSAQLRACSSHLLR